MKRRVYMFMLPIWSMLSVSFWGWGQDKQATICLPRIAFVEQRIIEQADSWFALHRVRLSPDVVCMLDFFSSYGNPRFGFPEFCVMDAHSLFQSSVAYYTYLHHHIVFVAKGVPKHWMKVYPAGHEQVFREADFPKAESLPVLKLPVRLPEIMAKEILVKRQDGCIYYRHDAKDKCLYK